MPQDEPQPEWLTTRDVSKLIGVPERTVRRWARSGAEGFPQAVRLVGRVQRVPRAELEAWLEERRAAAAREQ